MKKLSLYAVLLLFVACSGGTDKNNSSAVQNDQDTTSENSMSNNSTSNNQNPTTSLIDELSKIPPQPDYKVVGDVHVETMVFSSFGMGDMAHNIFTDEKKEERDFAGNNTNIELFLESASDENGGYISNPKYVGKKFTVGWRRVKSTKKPADFFEELYHEFDEIIYLKQLD